MYEQSVHVPLGLETWEIDEYVNSPLPLRDTVGYSRELLQEYRPNSSRYLPESATEKLTQIGEMRSRQLASSHALEQRIERLIVDVSFGSSKLEGISTNYLDAEKLILQTREADTVADRSEIAMILNHKDAIQFLLENREQTSSSPTVGFNIPTLQHIHTCLMSGIHPNPAEIGLPRLRQVGIEGSSYRPISTPTEITSTLEIVLGKCSEIDDPFEQSFFALVHLAYLQPFADGNKRTSRMMANLPLLKADLCPISFVATPRDAYTSGLLGVYEMNRIEMMRDVFISSYEQCAHRLHMDRDRQVAPTLLELRYRRQITEMVSDLIRSTRQDNLLEKVKLRVGGFNDLDADQKADLLHVILEESRKVTSATRSQYGITAEEFRAWDDRRPFYLNTEKLPQATRSPPKSA